MKQDFQTVFRVSRVSRDYRDYSTPNEINLNPELTKGLTIQPTPPKPKVEPITIGPYTGSADALKPLRLKSENIPDNLNKKINREEVSEFLSLGFSTKEIAKGLGVRHNEITKQFPPTVIQNLKLENLGIRELLPSSNSGVPESSRYTRLKQPAFKGYKPPRGTKTSEGNAKKHTTVTRANNAKKT